MEMGGAFVEGQDWNEWKEQRIREAWCIDCVALDSFAFNLRRK